MTGKLKNMVSNDTQKSYQYFWRNSEYEYLPLASGNFDWLIRLDFIKVTTSCDYNIHTSGLQSLYYHANI